MMKSLIMSLIALVALVTVATAESSLDEPFSTVMEEGLVKLMADIANQLESLKVPEGVRKLKQKVSQLKEQTQVIELPEQLPRLYRVEQFADSNLNADIPGIEDECEQYGSKVGEFLTNQDWKFGTTSIYMTWRANRDNPKEVAKNPSFYEAFEMREACCSIQEFSYCAEHRGEEEEGEVSEQLKLFEENIIKLSIPDVLTGMEEHIRSYADQSREQRLIELVFGKDRQFIMEKASQIVGRAYQVDEFKQVCQKFSNQMKALAIFWDLDLDYILHTLLKDRNTDSLSESAVESMKYVALREACLKISQLLSD